MKGCSHNLSISNLNFSRICHRFTIHTGHMFSALMHILSNSSFHPVEVFANNTNLTLLYKIGAEVSLKFQQKNKVVSSGFLFLSK